MRKFWGKRPNYITERNPPAGAPGVGLSFCTRVFHIYNRCRASITIDGVMPIAHRVYYYPMGNFEPFTDGGTHASERRGEMESWDAKAALASLADQRAALNNAGAPVNETLLAQTLIKRNLPLAVQSIVHLAMYSDNERIRLSASQYLIDHGLGKPGSDGLDNGQGAGSPIEKLLDQILVDDALTPKSDG
jgi:hypothetical protein